MFNRLVRLFDRVMRRYTPDPFIFATWLTFFVFGVALITTKTSLPSMLHHWGNGFWSLIPFTMQMVMVLVTGFIVATSPPVRRLLSKSVSFVKSPGQAVIATSLISIVGCYINWGFGLVISAFTCRAMAHLTVKVNYRALVASAYSGFLIWHGGLSGSIPLLLATPDNFSQSMIGRLMPLRETLFSPINVACVLSLLLILPLSNLFISRGSPSDAMGCLKEDSLQKPSPASTPAEKWETSPYVSLLVLLLAFGYLGVAFHRGQLQPNLNTVNFLFLMLGIALHGTPRQFIRAAANAAKKVSPILIQYPFYAGIMGMMQHSGLATQISDLFVALSTPATYPLLTFYSAGLVNFFIPSGGGQWAIQSPIVISGAQKLGADLSKSVMAVAWGDAWTNMAQPFWAIPLLAISGLKIRDIMGHCIATLLISGVVLSFIFFLL